MDGNQGRHTYIVESRRPIRRVQSIGDGTYAVISTAQSPVVTCSPILARPLILQSVQPSPLHGFQSHRFSPYQAGRRGRSNSDNSPAIVMMNTVVPVQATVIPTLLLTPSPAKGTSNPCEVACSPAQAAAYDTATIELTSSIPNKKVACSNCGIETDESNVCKRCRKIQNPDPTHVLAGIQSRLKGETQSPAPNGLPSSRFYNGASTSNTSDFMRYLKQANNNITTRKPKTYQRKRTNMEQLKAVEKTESVCITISSDSEEEDDATNSVTNSASYQITDSECSIPKSRKSSVDEIPAKRIKPDSQSSTADTDETPSSLPLLSDPSSPPSNPFPFTDESLTKATLNLKVDSARLGQMKLVPQGCCRVSHQNMTMTARAISIDVDVILTVPWQGVLTCDMCVDPREPCMYFTLNPSFIPNIRESLRMEKGKYPYYDPGGSDDEQYFIFYLNSPYHTGSKQCNLDLLWRKIDLIRKKLKRPMSFLRKISYSESALRQGLAASSDSSPDGSVSMEPARRLSGSQASSSQQSNAVYSQLEKIAADLTQDLNVSASHSKTRETPQRSVLTRRQLRAEESTDNSDTDDLKLAFSGPRIRLFVYPPPPSIGGISVTNEDQFCLNKGEFLNDVIIDFYLKYICNQLLSPADRARSHIFSCFFYERLMQKPARKNKDMSPSEQRHSQVKKWTRNVDIFSKDFIFVPINEASHWYLAVVCFASLVGTDVDAKIRDTLMKKGRPSIEQRQPTTALPASMRYLSSYGKSSTDTTSVTQGQVVNDVEVTKVKDGSAEVQVTGSTNGGEVRVPELDSKEMMSRKEHKSEPLKEKRKLITIQLPRFSQRINNNANTSILETAALKTEPGSGSPILKPKSERCKNVQQISPSSQSDGISYGLKIDSCGGITQEESSEIVACKKSRPDLVKEVSSKDPFSENEEALKAERDSIPSRVIDVPCILSPIHENATTTDPSVSGTESEKVSERRDENTSQTRDTTSKSGDALCPETYGSVQPSKDSKVTNNFDDTNDSAQGKVLAENERKRIAGAEEDCSQMDQAQTDDDTFEISLIPNRPTFTLPQDLQLKCRISPKKIEVRVRRMEKNNFKHCGEPPIHDVKAKGSEDIATLTLSNFRSSSGVPVGCKENQHDPVSVNHVDFEHCEGATKHERSFPLEAPKSEKVDKFELCAGAMDHGGAGESDATQSDTKDSDPEIEKSSNSVATSNHGAKEPMNNGANFEPCINLAKCDEIVGSISKCCANEENCDSNNSPAKPGETQDCSLKHDQISDPEPLTSPSRPGQETIVLSSDNDEKRPVREVLSSPAVSGCRNAESAKCQTSDAEPNGHETIGSNTPTSQELIKLFSSSSAIAGKSVYKKPCIVIFDSLRGPSRSKTASNIREYLCMEWSTRKHKTHGEKVFNKDTIKMSSANVPQQDNYSDCGVFLLHYVEKFFSNPLTNFSTPIRDLATWFDPAECKTKRDEIKNIIDALHEDSIARQAK